MKETTDKNINAGEASRILTGIVKQYGVWGINVVGLTLMELCEENEMPVFEKISGDRKILPVTKGYLRAKGKAIKETVPEEPVKFMSFLDKVRNCFRRKKKDEVI